MPEPSKLKSFPDFHPFTILSRVSARKKAFAQETGAAPKKTTDDQRPWFLFVGLYAGFCQAGQTCGVGLTTGFAS